MNRFICIIKNKTKFTIYTMSISKWHDTDLNMIVGLIDLRGGSRSATVPINEIMVTN